MDPSFGYKIAWLAIKNSSAEKIIEVLNIQQTQKIYWPAGIKHILFNTNPDSKEIFISSQIQGWNLLVGWYFFNLDKKDDDTKWIRDYTVDLSKSFDEVQAFGTHRVSEYHHWMKAVHGKCIRSLAFYVDILRNEGDLTDVEKSFPWEKVSDFTCGLDEEFVIKVAESWSINPTKITLDTPTNGASYIGKISL